MVLLNRHRRCFTVLAGLIGCLAARASFAATPLPRSAEQLSAYQPKSHIAGDLVQILITRWFGQIRESDVDGSIAAIEFLRGAPPSFVEPAIRKLRETDRLEKVLAAANSEQKDRLRNSQVLNDNRLRDLLWRDHLELLQAGLAAKSNAGVLFLIADVSAMQVLPAPLANEYLNALIDDTLNDQLRDEIAGMLRGRWAVLRPQTVLLKSWLRATPSPASDARRRLALSVLARLGEPLSDAEINEVATLNPADFLSIVSGNRAIAQAHVPQLLELLQTVHDPESWTEAYTILQAADPATLAEFYVGTSQQSTTTWSPVVLDRFIRSANPAEAAIFSGWNVDATTVDCDGLRWRLSLLKRQTTTADQRFAAAFDLLSKRSDCEDDLSGEIDDALTSIGGGQVSQLLLAALDRDGPGRLASMSLALPRVSGSMAGILDDRLAKRDLAAAKRLLDAGIIPSSEDLAQRNYWNQTFAPPMGDKLDVVDLRALQALDAPPAEALALARRIAGSQQAPVPLRNAALMALAAHAPAKEKAEAFLSAMDSGNAAIARPAIILLGQTYDEATPVAELPVPETDVMETMRTWPDVSADAAVLLKTLVRYDVTFARDYADALDSERYALEPGNRCLRLAESPTVDPRLLVPLLDIAVRNANVLDRDVALSCIVTLSRPGSATALLAQTWRGVAETDTSASLNALKSLWTDETFRASASRELQIKIGQIAGRLAQSAPFSTETMSALSYWRQEIAPIDPGEAQTISTELNKRRLFAVLALVPSAVFVHLSLWFLLVTAYPRFPWLQAVVFWNPVIRRILGLGYIDFVLLHVGFARRRIFSPFKASLLGDIVSENPNQLDRISYFTDSRVWHRPAVDTRNTNASSGEQPILQALSRHKGRVLLLGKSGLGKSSFLRYSLAARARQDRDVIAYLRADQCRNGVEAQLEERTNGLAKGNDLLSAMIYAGRIFIYIDGYNEVDLATQDAITGFLSRYPFANILVASQIPLRGFTTIETFEMIPLTGDAIRDFRLSREPVLGDNPPVRDELFRNVAVSFLTDVNARPRDDAEKKAFDDILSNPMDLTSVAILLGDGRTPDLFALEAQQLEGIAQKLAATGQKFRTEALSNALLEQRLQDQENLQKLPFQPEVAALVRGKLAIVRTDSDDAGAVASQEVRFRHDRIRDYFTHFAFLRLPPEKQAEFAEDARFAGVFPYLARALPKNDAEVLRERLITRAADLEDHRVSDSFVREYSWRQKISAQDPDWLPDYDLPEVRESDSRLFELTAHRKLIDQQVNERRDLISRSRAMTRILSAADPNFLRDAAVAIFLEMGAKTEPGDEGASRALLRGPDGEPFRVVGLCQLQAIKSFHVEVLVARFTGSNVRPLVVTNAHTHQDPQTRSEDLEARDRHALEAIGAAVTSARELYSVFLQSHGQGSHDHFWRFVFPKTRRTGTEA
ncbi:hypothetical protein LJR245_007319 [Rhizobium leguminosarum]|uniref:hypothetical protein n=1 Tax=Rhizobium leguminosarum TaxID=384 RepID=UPI0014412D7D|nr:hypothetical protein [Rhizobium leguminosarum]MBY5840938.1 hypothetical protein [Rhizobium leguminosarum]NKK77965.1 hypothetical protein [Rhizobium leguminosarum bv. viciae]NKL08834.1 hypothetical protein [Rhizobium leguminosarum bv. viciae]NKM80901.1 hypothetical protein [Rhizobium leguminosarum bv. viciae]QSZ12053.1 hypothetical protein J3P71_32665 [Rhizobium leguminosarum]